MPQEKRIVLIGHMPCTAGTYYTHFISKLLSTNNSAWIISETNPYAVLNTNKKTFLPYSININSFIGGYRTLENFLSCYRKELNDFIEYWLTSNSDLLIIRDHVWSEHFKDLDKSKKPIISEMLDSLGYEYTPIFTIRDPIDSLLSHNFSFPKDEINLNSYTNIYLRILQLWRDYHGNNLIEINIEDFTNNESKIDSIFFKKFSICNKISSISLKKNELSSGASGRFNSRPIVFKRRPYSLVFYEELKSNKKFLDLRLSLGYKDNFKIKNIYEFLKALIHTTYQPLLRLEYRGKKITHFLKFNKLAYK